MNTQPHVQELIFFYLTPILFDFGAEPKWEVARAALYGPHSTVGVKDRTTTLSSEARGRSLQELDFVLSVF